MYLCEEYRGEHEVRLLLILDNVGIVGHAEDPGAGRHRQRAHVLQKLGVVVHLGHVVDAARVKEALRAVARNYALVVVPGQDRIQGASVPFVGHAAAVIAFAFASRKFNCKPEALSRLYICLPSFLYSLFLLL